MCPYSLVYTVQCTVAKERGILSLLYQYSLMGLWPRKKKIIALLCQYSPIVLSQRANNPCSVVSVLTDDDTVTVER